MARFSVGAHPPTRIALGELGAAQSGTRLPPRPVYTARHAAALAGAGFIAVALLSAAHHTGPAVVVAVATVVAVTTRTVLGARQRARHRLADRFVEAICPALGHRTPTRSAVTVRGWTIGWPGTPRRITLRYAATLNDADPTWPTELLTIAAQRLQHDYRIRRHSARDRRHGQILIGLTPPADPNTPAPPEQHAVLSRARRAVTDLLGTSGQISEPDWDEVGELTAFTVTHDIAAKLAAPGYRRRVEQVLSTMLPGRWRASWDLEHDTARFGLRPTFPESIWLPVRNIDSTQDVLATYDNAEIPYGVDEDHHELVWRPAIDPNVMLVGAPGTGKTTVDHAILVAATRQGWPVWVVDGKAIEFLGFQDWPNVQVVATTIEEQIAVIHRAHQVMEHRYALITNGRARESDFEPLLVFLDEYADFRSTLMAWYAGIKVKGDPTKPVSLSHTASIARKGRTSRVHLVFATQRPDAEYFGGDMRDNFRMRVSMGRLSPQGAMMMWENPSVGITIPRGCRGRATTVNDANRAVEIQTYRTPDPRKTEPGSEAADLLDRLRPTTVRHQRLLILPPELDHDLDSGNVTSPTYSDYAHAPWVLAEDRPDLDPVTQRKVGHSGGRELASPMAVFGLPAPEPPARRDPRLLAGPLPSLQTPTPVALDALSEPPDAGVVDEFDGYGPAVGCSPTDVQIGDLVLVDDEAGQWAVIDADPEEDLAEAGCIALSWRDDFDTSGALTVPADTSLYVRHPHDQEDR